MRRNWIELRFANEESDKRVAEILIYDVIGGDWFGEGTTAKRFVEQLNALGDLDEIGVRINSPGGSIFDADAIYNALVRNKARVVVDIDGLAASCASWIAMAGDEIRIAENAMMMIHLSQGVTFGDKHDHAAQVNVLEKLDQNIAATYARRTGRQPASFLAMMTDETWFTAQEAVDNKLADSITKNKRASNLLNCFGPECARAFKGVPDAAKAWFAPRPANAACGCQNAKADEQQDQAVAVRLRQVEVDEALYA